MYQIFRVYTNIHILVNESMDYTGGLKLSTVPPLFEENISFFLTWIADRGTNPRAPTLQACSFNHQGLMRVHMPPDLLYVGPIDVNVNHRQTPCLLFFT